MKKIIAAAIVIAACAALCAAVWPRNEAGGNVPAGAESEGLSACMDDRSQPTVAEIIPLSDDTLVILAKECATPEAVEKTTEKEEAMAAPVTTDGPSPVMQETAAAPSAAIPAPQNSAPASVDTYHTDVYPDNVYSEELIYDADGNLIGKTTTYPSAFDSDTIWINGRAYYDLPGFGLIEWSGPGQRTEDYTMYESGVKVGVMGGEDEAPAYSAQATPSEQHEPTGEVIDQTINTRPEKSITPPDNKPNTAPPDNGKMNQQYTEQQINPLSAGACPH